MLEVETRLVLGGVELNERKESPNSVHFDCRRDEIPAIQNCTKGRLENCIACLDYAKHALCFSSGVAAVTSISQLLKNGDHVVMFDSVYHGTRMYLTIREAVGEVNVTFVDLRDPTELEKHLRVNTKDGIFKKGGCSAVSQWNEMGTMEFPMMSTIKIKINAKLSNNCHTMVWIETPSNPTMKLVDIAAVSHIIKTRSRAFLVVDNTFMSPYFQNPLLLGADIAMYSLTKYMNGHSDVLMGAAVTNDEDIYKELKASCEVIGSLPSPMDCYLTLRGLKTLHLRMERHMENASQVASFLENHPNVEKVFYPGLKSHPQYELAVRQCRGFSGMVSFCVKGGSVEVKKFASRVKIFIMAVSLGTAESLLDVPSLMTASVLPKEKREELGIKDNLIRLSIGLESAKDLIEDLDQALLL